MKKINEAIYNILKKPIDNLKKMIYLLAMIIKCDKCQTSFKLPDEKIKPEGIKVRCSKCKNVFTIFPPKTNAEKVTEEYEEKIYSGTLWR